tara:strand:- start:200 stop:415 length:216 start_codon:yes stop_codon:yes gene_type:complete
MQSTQCLFCKNYNGASDDGFHCNAYPLEKDQTIPEDIIRGKFDHREPFKGDNGIRYEFNTKLPFDDPNEGD